MIFTDIYVVGTSEVGRTWGETAWTAKDLIHSRKGGRLDPLDAEEDFPALLHGGQVYWIKIPHSGAGPPRVFPSQRLGFTPSET